MIAAPVTQEQAMTASRNWMATWAPQGFETQQINTVIPLSDKGTTQIYLFQFKDGFVATSADDAAVPILGYGFNTVITEMNANPAFRDYLKTMQEEIEEIVADNLSNTETAARWQAVLNNEIPRNNLRSVSPLITTRWNQDWPYNNDCPVDAAGPGGHVYAGCVATAMGQVMKYWNWPITGTGSHTYYATGYGSQTANFGNTTYLWAEMPNSVHSLNPAVAKLLYHCGVAVDMMYAPDGSGAYSASVPTAWSQYFRYSPTVQQKLKRNYSNANWEQLLRNELDAARPMYYSGSGSAGGHAFNCDGYQGTNYFHFNWGWGGAYDGYFYVSNLNPGSTFNNNQGAIINAFPLNYSIAAIQMGLQSMDCSVGDTVPVTVTTYPIMPEWNVYNVNFVIEYDNEYVQYMGFEASGTMLEGATINATLLQPGRIGFTTSSASVLSGGGNLLNVLFMPTIPGNYVFNLADCSMNSTPVSLVNAVSINVDALINTLQESVIDIYNALQIYYNSIATVNMTTTYLLPTWNVTTASFNLHYPVDLVSWEGYETVGCMADNAVIEVNNNSDGVLSFNLAFSSNLFGSGNLLKFRFRAVGNNGNVSLVTLTLSNFYYNQTPVQNLEPGYIVLMPVSANEDNLSVPAISLVISPNPFKTEANLSLQLAKPNQQTQVCIYNTKGQHIRTLNNTEIKGTKLDLIWDGKDSRRQDVPAGMYLVKMISGGVNKTTKLLRLK